MSRAAPVYLEFLARRAPAVSCCGAAKDATPMYVTPTSLGGVTPARVQCLAPSPKVDGQSPFAQSGVWMNPTPTPMVARSAACFQLTAASTKEAESNLPGGQRVHFQDPVEQHPVDCCSLTPARSEDQDGARSASMRSFSTCSSVSHFPSIGFEVKNTFIHVDSDVSDSDDDFYIPVQKSRSLPNASSLRSTNRSDVLDHLASHDPENKPSTRPRTQSESLTGAAKQAGLPSAGAKLHPDRCKPCAFFWKHEGCQNGVECYHCHACPQDEIRNRKKAKIFEFKQAKKLAKSGQSA